MSDIESVFWTVLFRMASREFLFFTPSDSSFQELVEVKIAFIIARKEIM